MKRKTAYVRVSTASDAQLHSYEFQEQYWRHKLTEDPDAEFCGIYADKGISGSSIRKRPRFLDMMQDAREHKFDEIHTKSVSRFSRNTVELLEAVRELRDLGIEVIFERENIHTFDSTSEVFLTIAATIAENDLEVDSERQRWSIRHRIQNGWISIGAGLYGYRMKKDNTLEIVPDEAEVVRQIYEWYIDGAGGQAIARRLNAAGKKTLAGVDWSAQRVLEILANEKFMGDTIMGKSVIKDGEKIDNSDGSHGPKYYIEDTHEGIVSKETWHKAQEIRQQRRNNKLYGSELPTYAFTGKIECACCGAHYQHKVNNSGKKWQTDIWACATKLHHGAGKCGSPNIKDSVLREKFIDAYNEFVTKRPQGETVIALREVLAKIRQEDLDLGALYLQNLVSHRVYAEERNRIHEREQAITAKIQAINEKGIRASDFTTITEYDPEKVEKFITKVIVSKGTVTFEFYNGVKISREYTNGQPGNKPGWNKKEEA